VDLFDVREVSSKWVGAGTTVPEGYSNRPSTGQGGSSRFDLFESPFLPYKEVEACDAACAFDNSVAYGFANGTFYAYDLEHAKLVSGDAVAFGTPVKVPKWKPPLLWQFKMPVPGRGNGFVIKAGERLYGCAGRKLVALESLAKEPRVAWEKDLAGTATSLIAADQKLFVATAEGGLYCFGKVDDPPAVPVAHEGRPVPLQTANGPWVAKAAEIVGVSGVKGGYCLVLGLQDGRLIEELLRLTELTVVGVDEDVGKVNALRRRFDAAGFYGSRVELFVGDPFQFQFPPYLASLMVSEDPDAAGFPGTADAARLFNRLRPYGGTFCLIRSAGKHADFEAWAKAGKLEKAVLKRAGECSLLVREGSLPGSAPWIQEACDAARTFCSQDELVKAPLGFLWYGDQNGFTQFHDYNSGVKPQVVGGRVFAFQQQSRNVTLFAYDAYTGRFLWKNEVASSNRLARFSAQVEAVYLIANGKCLVYAPDTGALLNTFTIAVSGPAVAKDLRVDGDVIVVACSDPGEYYWKQGHQESSVFVGLDRRSGVERWRREARDRFNNGAFAMGDGMVFGVDSLPMSTADKWKPRTAGLKEVTSTVFALESGTGREVWSKKITYAYADGGMDDWVAYSAKSHLLLTGRMGLAAALNARTGTSVWEKKKFGQMPLLLREEMFMDLNGLIYDFATGNPMDKACRVRRTGCGYATGSRNLILTRDNSASYADIGQGKAYHLRNIRSGCSNTLTPADGLLNVPNYSWGCVCNYAVQTSFAMIYMPEVAGWSGTVPLTMSPPSQPVRP
jgi:outer membrane protein assembly factor BamB